MILARILILFTLSSFAEAKPGDVYFVEWTPPGFSRAFLLPARESETPAQAIARYRRSVLMNPELSYLHSVLREMPKNGDFRRLETPAGSQPLGGVIANKPSDLSPNSPRIQEVTAPLESRKIRTVILPPNADSGLSALEALRYRRLAADTFDLLHAIGGDDLDNNLYGLPPNHVENPIPARDLSEFLLVKEYYRRGRGILFGICRGSQMIAIVSGCALVQDIEKELNRGNHRLGKNHEIYPLDQAAYERLVGSQEPVPFHSYHHQSTLLNPRSFMRQIADDGEGVVELIEHPNRRVVGVQFHPERNEEKQAENLYDEIAARVHRIKKVSCMRMYEYFKEN